MPIVSVDASAASVLSAHDWWFIFDIDHLQVPQIMKNYKVQALVEVRCLRPLFVKFPFTRTELCLCR